MLLTTPSGTSPDEWQGSVVTNLTQASDAHREASNKIANSFTAIRRTNAEHARQRDSVHGQFSQKIRNTEGLSHQLSSSLKLMRNTSEHTEWSLGKLKSASQALANPMHLVKQRLALRQKRPKRELVVDPFQQSLLAEEKEIQASKAKLNDAMTETQKLVRELHEVTSVLEADLQDKQNALNIDSCCLHSSGKGFAETRTLKLDKLYNRKDVGSRPVFPELMATPRDAVSPPGAAAMSEGRLQERNRQLNTLRIVEAAVQLEKRAKAQWNSSLEVIEAVNKAQQHAFKRTQADLGAKIEHTELLRQELLKQKRVTEQTLHGIIRCYNRTSEKLNFLEKPSAANSARTAIRARRTGKEAIDDEVSEALFSQRSALQDNKTHLQDEVHRMDRGVDALQAALQQLEQDIRDKEMALAIDRQCAACRNAADGHLSFGFAKVGQGQRHFSDTCSSKLRQAASLTNSSGY